MPERKEKPGRLRSVSKMTKEDAKRLRELLRTLTLRTCPTRLPVSAWGGHCEGEGQAIQAVISLGALEQDDDSKRSHRALRGHGG
jgi:hypothetical protein